MNKYNKKEGLTWIEIIIFLIVTIPLALVLTILFWPFFSGLGK